MTGRSVAFGDLIAAAGASLYRGGPATAISSVHYDSREVCPGGLFVALRGGYADGHDFLEDALRRGASAALVESIADVPGFDAVGVSDNTRAALSPLAARFYDFPGDSLGVVGVTGTDGKTTTTYLIDALLRANGIRTGLVGTIATRIADRIVAHDTRQTTPESLEVQRLLAEMRSSSVDWAILEATSHALALYRLDDCPFDIGVVTNVTREHLDFHGTLEAYRDAKAELLRKVVKSTGRPYSRGAVVNLDDPGARYIGENTGEVPVVWFSLSDGGAAVRAEHVRVHAEGTAFRLTIDNEQADVDLKLIGGYNVFNAMAAAGAGHLLGLDIESIKSGLESLPHVPGRMQQVNAGQPFNVIVDYAHSPASLEETLRLVRSVTRGRVITVFGSAGERDRGKRAVQGEIGARLADISIFTSEDPRFEEPERIVQEIANGARGAGAVEGTRFHCVEDRREAIGLAMRVAEPGDTVLLAGKGHETCMIYGDQRIPWDEAAEARRALEDRGFDPPDEDSEGTE